MRVAAAVCMASAIAEPRGRARRDVFGDRPGVLSVVEGAVSEDHRVAAGGPSSSDERPAFRASEGAGAVVDEAMARRGR